MALNLKVKRALLKRKINGELKVGYYGRVITNGTKTVDDIMKASTHGSTIDYREAKLATEMMIDGITEAIKQGYIVDLDVLGKLYPAVNGSWKENPDDLMLSEMKGKVNYKPGEEITAAVKGAKLTWTVEKETDENTVEDADNQPQNTGGGAGDDGGDTIEP